jgi:superfamily II RNA helicase
VLKSIYNSSNLLGNIRRSLLSTQDNEEVRLLLKEQVYIEGELNSLSAVSEKAKRAIRFETAHKQNMLNKKDNKTYVSEIKPWIEQNRLEYENAIASAKLMDQLALTNRSICAIEQAYERNLMDIVKYLSDIGYLTLSPGSDAELTKDKLTVKGVMAMEVNECNPIMLTELIHGTYLDDLDFADIVSVLAIFLDVSGEKRDVQWTPKSDRSVTRFLKDMDRYEVQESRGSPVVSDWSANDYLCDLARLWVTSEIGLPPMLQELSITDLQPGEFVRMMLKLDNICKEASSIAKICGKDRLVGQLDGHNRSIIRNIVTPQSLYVG